jgi:hypothetical protein
VSLQMPAALGALDEIEALRTSHVRGDMPNGPEAARRALACLALLRDEVAAGVIGSNP